MAGPLSPPTRLPRTGFLVSISMAIPVKVLTRLKTSAPASTAARARRVMSVTLGVSLTIRRVSGQAFRTARTSSARRRGSLPKVMPPSRTLGQLTFSSSPRTGSSPYSREATATYSSMVLPATFTKTGTGSRWRRGIFSSQKSSSPTLARPMAFSMPEWVSQVRWGGFPGRGSRVMLLVIKPPSRVKSTKSRSSIEYPQVPEAVSTGLANCTFPRCTERSG
ncbi:MAG: hypothetical protein BWY71_01197 [Planctomycetes bacterium ADurb.Bin412]|nr:MAG: hypothetical protein BWY71_01197 [Planctomycetes bacterium ADurb.Bin412]